MNGTPDSAGKPPSAQWWTLDPYRFPGMRGAAKGEEPGAQGPDPARPCGSPPSRLSSVDRRRLDLQACLTVAGIPLLAGDPHAIEVLAGIDETTYAAVRRWISHTR
ncbi:hypothetical protein [Streptomyces sp. NPDC048551]|uniref:hypothetical protein n=1 Tax=Streptomyces sp. NPDC048551 TaxID=3155758 RepID=UPI0034437274